MNEQLYGQHHARHTTHLGGHQIGRFEFLKFHVRKVIQLHCRNTNSQIQLPEHETLLESHSGQTSTEWQSQREPTTNGTKICLSS